jgi:hypothetical protein
MRFQGPYSRWFWLISFASGEAFAASPVTQDSTAPAILPKQFAGWQMQGAAQASKDAGAADPTNAALLKEYGFRISRPPLTRATTAAR